MFESFWAYFERHLIADVPDQIAACMDCGVVQCVGYQFRGCSNRLARAAALKALRESQGQETAVTP